MKFKADEIASVIQQEIEDFRGTMETAETGRVLEVGDGIARCYGLSGAMAGEMVEFSSGSRGMVQKVPATIAAAEAARAARPAVGAAAPRPGLSVSLSSRAPVRPRSDGA